MALSRKTATCRRQLINSQQNCQWETDKVNELILQNTDNKFLIEVLIETNVKMFQQSMFE